MQIYFGKDNPMNHDRPAEDYTIRSGRVIRPSRSRASLAALQWAADRANQSYGTFTLHLRPEDEARIQIEFDEFISQRNAAAAARRAEKATEAPTPCGFIITDDDA